MVGAAGTTVLLVASLDVLLAAPLSANPTETVGAGLLPAGLAAVSTWGVDVGVSTWGWRYRHRGDGRPQSVGLR